MAKIQPKNNKNIVTVGRLKQVVSDLKEELMMREGEAKVNPEFVEADDLKKMNEKRSQIKRYEAMIANPSKFQPKSESKPLNKNMVTVGRLKQVRDSLVEKGQNKMGGGDMAIEGAKRAAKSGGKDYLGRTPDKAMQSAQELYSSGRNDLNRADKYSKIINKAGKK